MTESAAISRHIEKKLDTWMPLYIGDYLADTGHLTTEEHGAYLLLILHYWRAGPLPDDDRLATIARLPAPRWRKIAPTIRAFFKVESGFLRHKRIEAEKKATEEIRQVQSAAGKAAAEARWGAKRKGARSQSQCDRNANTDAIAMRPQCESHTGRITTAMRSQYENDAISQSQSQDYPSSLRSDGLPPPPLDEDRDREAQPIESEDALAIPDFLHRQPSELSQAVDVWNDLAGNHGLAKVQKLTKERSGKLKARLKDCGGIEGWKAALAKVAASPFLLGETGWRADFDFLLQPSSFIKLMEGSYDRSETHLNDETGNSRRRLDAGAHRGVVASIAAAIDKMEQRDRLADGNQADAESDRGRTAGAF